MITKSIMPKKIATLSLVINGHKDMLDFIEYLNKSILNKFIKIENTNDHSLALLKINKIVKDIKSLEWISKTIKLNYFNFEVKNQFINSIQNECFYIGGEVKFNKASPNFYNVIISFYALDNKARIIKKLNGAEILIPNNSYVYQVNDENVFKAYQLNDLFYFARVSSKMREIKITKIGNDYYQFIGVGSLVKIDIINNTNKLNNNVVKSHRINSTNKDHLTTYISNARKEVNLPIAFYMDGLKFKIDIYDKNLDAEFIVYNLKNLNPTLKGKVKAILIDKELYLSDVKLDNGL